MSVRFPEMRARLQEAVDALCNADLQERLWLRGRRVSASELGFHDTLLFIVDEMEMFTTADLVGDVLIDESELLAFKELVAAVESLIETIGERGSFRDALATGASWQSCAVAARELQRRLKLAKTRTASPPPDS